MSKTRSDLRIADKYTSKPNWEEWATDMFYALRAKAKATGSADYGVTLKDLTIIYGHCKDLTTARIRALQKNTPGPVLILDENMPVPIFMINMASQERKMKVEVQFLCVKVYNATVEEYWKWDQVPFTSADQVFVLA